MSDGERLRFLTEHAEEFLPATADRELLSAIEHSLPDAADLATLERVKRAVEQLETKVYRLEKALADVEPGAQRVLLTASETLAYRSVEPLIAAMRTDRRVRSIGLVTDNLAANLFAGHLDGFEQQRQPGAPMMYDAMRMAEDEPFDVTIVPVDPRNSPNAIGLYGAKSAFGTKRLYFLATGWVGVGASSIFAPERREQMDEIDGVFVADRLAGDIIRHQLPELPPDRILETGVPVVDALDRGHGADYARSGREKLGLDPDTLTVLLLGFVSPPKGSGSTLHERISEQTHELTLHAVAEAARRHPDRKYAVINRPHPTDPNAGELLQMAEQEWPENMRVVDGREASVTMQEAAYAADVTASITGTDTFLAPRRGRRGVFLGYREPGMGGQVLDGLYGPELEEVIGQGEGLSIVESPNALTIVLENTEPSASPAVDDGDDRASVERILATALQVAQPKK